MFKTMVSGHANGDDRTDFELAVESEDSAELKRLRGVLWNCTDIAPRDLCNDLDQPEGSTYAQLVRKLDLAQIAA